MTGKESPACFLITGGAGFIGSHLAEALVQAGNEVLVLDNLSTGSLENLAHLRERIKFVQGSVLDRLVVDDLVSECDAVFHLAAAVGVRLVVERPLHSFKTNIEGAENVLDSADRYGRKVLLTSSSEIYGKSGSAPFREDDDRVLGDNKITRWGYATSKAVDEILAFAFHRERGLPTVVVRLFNTVGPRQTGSYGMVLPNLVSQAVKGNDLTVFGDGRQTRCFCHVSDVVEAMMGLMSEPSAEGDVFNVGSTEEITIEGVAQLIVELSSSSSKISFLPYDEAYEKGFEDMRKRVPDITKIGAATGWKPKITLREILDELISIEQKRE